MTPQPSNRRRLLVFASLLSLMGWTGAQAQTYSGANNGPVTGNGGALTVNAGGSITNPGGSVAVLANSGSGAITTLTNNGTISAGSDAVATSQTGSITTLQNNATIVGTNANGNGVTVQGTIGTLNNAGTLSGSSGIYNVGTITALNNQTGGAISGTNGYGIQSGNAIGSFTNEAGATVSGAQYSFLLNASNSGPQPSMGAFNNAGTMTGAVQISGGNRSLNIASFANSGTITDTAGSGGVSLAGGVGGVTSTLGNVSNTGSITSTGSGLSIGSGFSSVGTLSNSGSISGNNVGVSVGAGVTAGFTNSGTIQGNNTGFQGGSGFGTLTNAAGGTISGHTGVDFQNQSTGAPGLVNNGTINGTQNFAVIDTYSGTHLQQITNTGTINGAISLNGSAITITGGGSSFGVLNGGTYNAGGIPYYNGIFASGANITFTGNTRLNESVVTDYNTGIHGTVANNGTLQLANQQNIYGYYTQGAGSTLDLMFAGTSVSQYGNLTASLAAVLSGGLALETTGGFNFNYGQTFDIMDFASRSGDFSSMSLNGLACSAMGTDVWNCGGGLLLTEVFSANGKQLNLVTSAPEPASLAILAVGVAGLMRLRRQRV